MARNFQGTRGKLWMVERVFLIFWTLFDGCRIFPRNCVFFFLSLSLSWPVAGWGGGGLGWGCSLLRRPSQLRAALNPPPLPQSPSLLPATGRLFSLLPLLSPFLPWALWRLVGIEWLCGLGSAPPPILLLLCNGPELLAEPIAGSWASI